MMKKIKKILYVLGFSLLIVQNVYASDMDPSVSGNLEINYVYADTKIENATIKLYKIADISSDSKYTYTEQFAGYEEDVNEKTTSELKKIAKNLENTILEKQISATRVIKTDQNGKAIVSNLSTGLYLITTEEKTINNDKYDSAPSLISVPSVDEITQQKIYNITINIKTEITKNETVNPSQTPNQSSDNTTVPNTLDQIYLYVSICLVSLIVILFLIYWLKNSKKGDKENEK